VIQSLDEALFVKNHQTK